MSHQLLEVGHASVVEISTDSQEHCDTIPNDGVPARARRPGPESLPLEIRVHGRGGQGGVTCAKLIASLYSRLGLHVQTFGDYGMERAGAPVRAFTRVDTAPIANRNKVVHPDHLLVLDPGLPEEDVLEGVQPGAFILLNAPAGSEGVEQRYTGFRGARVDATAIARKHGIGSSAVVIVNTTVVGAYARALDVPWALVETLYGLMSLGSDLAAAREAYDRVVLRPASQSRGAALPGVANSFAKPRVIALTEHDTDFGLPFRTGSWRTQTPRYRTGVAPCSGACPAGNDIRGFLQTLRTEGVDAAARVLLETQPLPSVCGRVCPAPCMEECNRGAHDGAVNVRGLERWVGDRAPRVHEPVSRPLDRRRIAVVGGGPAGLSAAHVFARAGHEVTIFEAQSKLGGVLRTGIPAYRLPEEALDRDVARILSLGVRAETGVSMDGQGVRELAGRYHAILLATGRPFGRAMDCPGVHLEGIGQGLQFLRASKNGGAPRLRGRVLVIGGGNTAIDCARTALRRGAARVSLVYRRSLREMPAIPAEITEALEEGMEILPCRQPVGFFGEKRVQAAELAHVELGAADESGRARPSLSNRTELIACDAVLLALGQETDTSLLAPDSGELPENVWLAGDAALGEGTVAYAVGHGCRVARALLDALGRDRTPERSMRPPFGERVGPELLRFAHFETSRPQEDRHLAPAARVGGFEEVNRGLADSREAERCFSCGGCTRCDTCLLFCPEGIISRFEGGYRIDGEYCKGCGVCVVECPRAAMEMTVGTGLEVRS
ncbi:MAG: FAD-dependent oxidoreductase [Deltaproteobacteria bacterium]|nr:FAD-dependent oxidoreductase [Deltaproteobacteria bacterium]